MFQMIDCGGGGGAGAGGGRVVKKNRNDFSVIFLSEHYSFRLLKKMKKKTENTLELSTL